jgi:hypothetical protein
MNWEFHHGCDPPVLYISAVAVAFCWHALEVECFLPIGCPTPAAVASMDSAMVQIICRVVLYGSPMLYHSHRAVLSYRQKFRKPSALPLSFHILASAFELVRYEARALRGPVLPDELDLLACLAQTCTSLVLARTLLRGDASVTRASYQAGALLRMTVGVLAYSLQNVLLYRGAVRLLDAFFYTRFVIFLGHRLGLGSVYKGSTIYMIGVFLGALLSMHESQVPGAVPAYVLAVGVLVMINRGVSERVERCGTFSPILPSCHLELTCNGLRCSIAPAKEHLVAHYLMKAGFAEIATIRRWGKGISYELSCAIEDEYID